MDEMKKWMAFLLCVCMLWGFMADGMTWGADEFYQSQEELPPAVNRILDTMLEPGEKMLDAHRQGKTIFMLSEDWADMRRVFIFRDEGAGYALDVVSPPLAAIGGVKPTIGSGGDLYLMYESNYCIHRAGGRWLLYYVQFVDDYWIYPHHLQLEMIQGEPGGDYPPVIGRYTGERDLARLTAEDLPRRFSDARAKLDRNGYAVVNNPNPKDRLHLRARPDRRADSLGKFYNGTILQVLEKRGEWRRVAIGSLEGWMMGEYLAEGEAMDQVKKAFPILDLKEEMENAPRFAAPEERADQALGAEWLREWQPWIIGVYGEDWFILMSREGQLYYQKQVWFWEGNG